MNNTTSSSGASGAGGVWKTILTVLLAVVCILISLGAVSVFFSQLSYLPYELQSMTVPEFLSAEASPYTETGNLLLKEDQSCFLVKITLANPGNYGINASSLFFSFEPSDEEEWCSVENLEISGLTCNDWNGNGYLPAGRQTVVYAVIALDQNCRQVDLVYRNYHTDEEIRIPISL